MIKATAAVEVKEGKNKKEEKVKKRKDLCLLYGSLSSKGTGSAFR